MIARATSRQPRLPIIAIDGPAGAGKTTTARQVAARLGLIHLDTGAMYRAVALKALRQGCDIENHREIERVADSAKIEIRHVQDVQRVFLDGEDVTEAVRLPEVSKAVSPVSEIPGVRRRLVAMQRQLGQAGGVVMEGRDIGTVVFPDADLKIFLTADLKERTRRREKDLEASGVNADFDSLAAAIKERDRRDQSRADSPLRRAPDAISIDTTQMTFEEQVEEIVRLFQAKCG